MSVLAVLVPIAFVVGLLGAPILYLLTYGEFWSSMGTAVTGFGVLGTLIGGVYGFAGFFGRAPQARRTLPPRRPHDAALPVVEGTPSELSVVQIPMFLKGAER